MANVDQELAILAAAKYGSEVRDAIIDSIEAINEESVAAKEAAQTSQTSCTASAAAALGYKNDTQQLKTDVQGLKTDCQTIKGQCTDEKTAAQTAATNAGNSASAASGSATAAASSENNASGYASAASTSATNASASATSASGSASAAAQSATDAAASATQAAASATAAGTSATSASNSATAAAQSSAEAQSYSMNAYTSSTNAANSASAANSSASYASQKATAAETSASASAASATQAATSAASAQAIAPGILNFEKTIVEMGSFYFSQGTATGVTLLDHLKKIIFNSITMDDAGFCTDINGTKYYTQSAGAILLKDQFIVKNDVKIYHEEYDPEEIFNLLYKLNISGRMLARDYSVQGSDPDRRAYPIAGEIPERGFFQYDVVVWLSNSTASEGDPTVHTGDRYVVIVDTTDNTVPPVCSLVGPWRVAAS